MSFDLKLSTVCDHKIDKELIALNPDRQSIRLSKPLAASVVDVYASDNLISKTDYIIIYDSQTINIQQPRLIFLKKKWKSLEDYFEVSYITLNSFCPKCAGTNEIDDISYDVKGDLLTLRDEKLLLQNMEKFTVTEIQSNPFHDFVGTSLTKLLGQKINNTSYITTKVTQEINTTLNVFKSLQDQYRYTGRNVTTGELLDTIDNIQVKFDKNDPTILTATVTAKNKTNRSITYTQFLQI